MICRTFDPPTERILPHRWVDVTPARHRRRYEGSKVIEERPRRRRKQVAEQVTNGIRSVALPVKWADWMLAELAHERRHADATATTLTDQIDQQLHAADQKLDRLMTA